MRRPATAAMMNLVTIGLVLSTLAAAVVWSPSPSQPSPPAHQNGGDHAVREGRRVVIVEYEREADGSLTEKRELASHPLDEDGEGEGARVLDEARGVVSEAADEGKERPISDAKEGVLGAVKRCKDRLCGAGKRVEEGAKRAAWSVEHGAEDAAETVADAKDSAENTAFDAARRGKETVTSARDKASEAASRGKETAKSATGRVSEAAGDAKESAKDKVAEAADKAKEKASHLEHGAVDAAKHAKDKVSEAAKHVKHNAKDTVRGARDTASHIASRAEDYASDAADKAEEAEQAVKAKAGEVRRNLTDIARRAREVAADAAAYLLGPMEEAAHTATAVMHLLGLATAFSASVWVTFLSSYVLAAALPRHQLGVVQSKMYPVYFRAVAYGVGLALVAHLLGAERGSVSSLLQSLNLLAALGLVLANMTVLEPKATKVMFERMKVEKEEGRGQDMADIVDPPAVTVATTATYAATAARAEAAAARTHPHPPETTTGKVSATPATGKATKGDAEMSKSRVLSLNKQLKALNSYSSLCNVLSLMALGWHLVHLARRLLHGTAC